MTTSPAVLPARRQWFAAAAPALFVLLWSTGFIGAKYGLPYAEPLTFLLLRFAIVLPVLLAVVLLGRMPWPTGWPAVAHSAVTGVLLHAAYLGGVFVAIHLGMPAGIASLVVGTQPLLTAAVSPLLLGEPVAGRQWVGLALGFVGVALVIGEKLLGAGIAAFTPLALVAIGIALIGTTAGTIYQRRFGAGIPLGSGTFIQYIAASAVMLVAALLFEHMQVQWTPTFVLALLWLVFALSLGAILILMYLLRTKTAASTSSLFYLVPPATAIEAFLLFNERLGWLALCGMAMVGFGVWMVVAQRRA